MSRQRRPEATRVPLPGPTGNPQPPYMCPKGCGQRIDPNGQHFNGPCGPRRSEASPHAPDCDSFDFDLEKQLGPDKPCNCRPEDDPSYRDPRDAALTWLLAGGHDAGMSSEEWINTIESLAAMLKQRDRLMRGAKNGPTCLHLDKACTSWEACAHRTAKHSARRAEFMQEDAQTIAELGAKVAGQRSAAASPPVTGLSEERLTWIENHVRSAPHVEDIWVTPGDALEMVREIRERRRAAAKTGGGT